MADRQCDQWLNRGFKDGCPTLLCRKPARWRITIFLVRRGRKPLATDGGQCCTYHKNRDVKDYERRGHKVEVHPLAPLEVPL